MAIKKIGAEEKCFFSADFHLMPEDSLNTLRSFLSRIQSGEHCFFLGDFFEVWYECRNQVPKGYYTLLNLLKGAVDRGVVLHLLKGNRDFLAGSTLMYMTGMHVYEGPLVLEQKGQKIVLMHGDELLPDDVSYQKYKRIIRSAPVLALAKILPEHWVQKVAGNIRQKSKVKLSALPANTFEPKLDLVEDYFKKANVVHGIAGHLHKKLSLVNKDESICVQVLNQSTPKTIHYRCFENGVLSEELSCSGDLSD